MRSLIFSLLVGVFFVGVSAQPAARAQAQRSQAAMTQGATAPPLRMGRYDKSTEVVTSGTILSIQSQKNAALPRGTYLVLQSGALTLNVHMGLFSSAAIPFASGDQVQVTGSLIPINGAQILLARQVQSTDKSVTVRSSNGFVIRPYHADRMQGFQQ